MPSANGIARDVNMVYPKADGTHSQLGVKEWSLRNWCANGFPIWVRWARDPRTQTPEGKPRPTANAIIDQLTIATSVESVNLGGSALYVVL